MPYNNISDLPDKIKDNLPQHGQEIYCEAFNNAWEQYQDPEKRRGNDDLETVAHKIAWSAVKKVYRKDRKSGEWIRK